MRPAHEADGGEAGRPAEGPQRELTTRFNGDSKFDFQLGKAIGHEHRLAAIFEHAKFELKTETHQWKRTGNICIEFRQKGQPSGIAVTEADVWVHQLCDDDGSTLIYLMFPIEQLKGLCRDAYKAGQVRRGGGDNGDFDNIILRLTDIPQWLTRKR